MQASHAATAQLRLRLAPAQDVRALAEASPRQYQALAESGVAGMRALDGVKCLHAHLADYLGRSKANPMRSTRSGARWPGSCSAGASTSWVTACPRRAGSQRSTSGATRRGCLSASGGRAAIAYGGGPQLEPVFSDLEMTRLGAGLDARGAFQKDSDRKDAGRPQGLFPKGE